MIALIGGCGALAGFIYYSLCIEQFNIQVKEFELGFPNLPPAFDGYTILHLSDLHITKLGLLEKKTMDIISKRKVDTCLITGDVTSQPRASDNFRRVASAIPHRDPIYMVIGNSEHKPWVDTDILLEALSFDGLKILLNSSASVERGSDRISLVGVDDAYSKRDDVSAAFAGVDPSDFIVFLTHCPSTAPKAIEHGADLSLAGHTHGGQVRLPRLGPLWSHMHHHRSINDGLYLPEDIGQKVKIDPGHSVIFVNRGVGSSRLHFRFLCPPEVAYITLRRI